MLFSQDSQLILRHQKIFQEKKIFFSGNIQDILPIYILAKEKRIHLQTYFFKFNNTIKKETKRNKNIYVYQNLTISKEIIQNCNTLIYFWPKNKNEAKFQLFSLLSSFFIGSKIFIVGAKSSGVKSVQLILKEWINLKKIDYAKHSILFFGVLEKNTKFKLNNFFKIHILENLVIKVLPGVFGYKKIDEGSKLLVSTFLNKDYGKILDVGCGSGFLSVAILKKLYNSSLTMIDNKISSIISSKETLKSNRLMGKVILSDIYSNISEKFNIIISNPPFHNDLQLDFQITKNIIINSMKYLKKRGELRFVTNNHLNYDYFLNKYFKKFFILDKNKKYKVYQAFL